MTPVQDKLEAVRQWPKPSTRKQLKGFLGLAGYYSEFINGFTELAAPLTELSREENDVASDWDEQCDKSFDRLKLALTAAPVLRLADPTLPYQLFVDASLIAAGAVLTQKDADDKLHPVAYFGKKFSRAEGRYGATARELLGLVLALRKWRHYLMGCNGVELWTDCKPLTWLRTQAELQPMHIRWLELLAHFPVNIMYVKGVENVVADALSRRPDYEAAAGALASLSQTAEDDSADEAVSPSFPELEDDLLFELCSELLSGEEDGRADRLHALETAGEERTDGCGLEELLEQIRQGYESDQLVVQARQEAARRAASGERAPQSAGQAAGRPTPKDQRRGREQAALEAARRRIKASHGEGQSSDGQHG